MQSDQPSVGHDLDGLSAADRKLSEREIEILGLVATGASNKEIAQRLFISPNTVKVHLRRIFKRIGATSRTEAALYAVRQGMISLDRPNAARMTSVSAESRIGTFSIHRLNILRRPLVLAISIGLLLAVSGFLIRNQLVRDTAASPESSPVFRGDPQRWQAKADLPTARSRMAIATYNGQIIAIGGESMNGITGQVHRFNPIQNLWTETTMKPVAVADAQAAVIGGRIFVPGGRLPSGENTNVVEVYDPLTDQWDRAADLPVAISAYALSAFEGSLYLFGGWDGESYLDLVLEYDPALNRWREAPSMQIARGYASAVAAGGVIHVIGGYDGSKALRANAEYSPEREHRGSGPWSESEPLPEGRYAMGAASVAGIVHVIGGVVEDGSAMILRYLPQEDRWETSTSAFITQNWSHLGLAPIESYLYAVGGIIEEEVAGKNLAYRAVYTILLPLVP